jgi:RND superfamily putative drug exporter
VTNVKAIGVGMALAVLVDATIVRALLVPAFMRLAGRWNWWAPRSLKVIHERLADSQGRRPSAAIRTRGWMPRGGDTA